MHYYQHHIGDFARDTANLDDHQLATYMRMLWAYYGDENPLHDDCERIAFAVRSNEKTVRLLLQHYFTLTPEGWRHSRCDREIQEYKAKADKARNSANARWKNANALPPHSERNANEPVLDANQEPRTKNQGKEEEANASLPATPPCPHQQIVALYHEHLPANPRIKIWDGNRAATLQARWREDPKRQSVDYWARFFRHCAGSKFLTGQVEDRGGRPFTPGLDWLVKASNFAKIIEGRYHDRGQA